MKNFFYAISILCFFSLASCSNEAAKEEQQSTPNENSIIIEAENFKAKSENVIATENSVQFRKPAVKLILI